MILLRRSEAGSAEESAWIQLGRSLESVVTSSFALSCFGRMEEQRMFLYWMIVLKKKTIYWVPGANVQFLVL